MSRLGYEIKCDEFPRKMVDEVEEWYQTGKNAFEMLFPNPKAPKRDVYIGILNGHGSVIVISDEAWQNVRAAGPNGDAKIKIPRYHICKTNDKNSIPFLKKDEEISAKFVLRCDLNYVASTQLADDQLDRLALFCRRQFTVYQLVRQDCLQFAKSMTIQIAVNENQRSLKDVNKELENLHVLDSGDSSASSEAKSRRNVGWPKAYVPAFLGISGAFTSRYSNYVVVSLLLASVSYLVIKFCSSWF